MGNKSKAVNYSLQAGKASLSQFSNVEAIKHFAYDVNSIQDEKEFINVKISALDGLGDAYQANSMFKEAIETFEILGDIGTGILRLRAFRKAMEPAFQLGDIASLKELIIKAEKYVAADRLEKARVLLSKGRIFTMQNKAAEALENFEAALQVFGKEYSSWDTAWGLIGVGIRSPGL